MLSSKGRLFNFMQNLGNNWNLTQLGNKWTYKYYADF